MSDKIRFIRCYSTSPVFTVGFTGCLTLHPEELLEALNHRILICKLIFLFVVVVKEFLSTSILFNRPGRYLLSTFGPAFARTTWPIWITSVSCGQRVLCRKLFLKSQSYMDGAARYAPYTAPLYWIPWPNPCTLSDRKVSDILNDNAGLQHASK